MVEAATSNTVRIIVEDCSPEQYAQVRFIGSQYEALRFNSQSDAYESAGTDPNLPRVTNVLTE